MPPRTIKQERIMAFSNRMVDFERWLQRYLTQSMWREVCKGGGNKDTVKAWARFSARKITKKARGYSL